MLHEINFTLQWTYEKSELVRWRKVWPNDEEHKQKSTNFLTAFIFHYFFLLLVPSPQTD